MGETPSKRRRRGRAAFIPGDDPLNHQPYNKNKWGYDIYLADWLEGWEQARRDWEFEESERAIHFEHCPPTSDVVTELRAKLAIAERGSKETLEVIEYYKHLFSKNSVDVIMRIQEIADRTLKEMEAENET